MSTPLRAFLLWRPENGEWQVEVSRDLEGLVRAWEECSRARSVAGVVHIGFERSLARHFDDLAREYPQRVLLTAAAKHALPRSFRASAAPVGEVDGQAVHLATSGWGYELDDIVPVVRKKASSRDFRDWLADFVAEHPASADLLRDADVFDDPSYCATEASLDVEIRKQLGLARFRALIGDEEDDPCAVARAAPPWLRDREFTTMNVRVRIANVFNASNIRTVADLGEHSTADLLRMPNFGRTSVADLLGTLTAAMRGGPPDMGRREQAISDASLLQAVRRSLLAYGTRERDILNRRMGFDGPAETLSEIGESYGITRERVRQLEAKTLSRLLKDEVWGDLLARKLSALLRDREFPLPVLGVEAIDPWFSGIAAAPNAFRYILSNMCATSANIVEVDGIAYLAFLDQQRWEATLSEARRLLASGTDDGWTEQHCRSLVYALLPDQAADFRTLLWERATVLCHFSDDDTGGRVLRSYGRGAEQLVEAVLHDADRPLHYSEILERVSLRSKREFDIRRIHNAAAAVGFLLGRGTFGLAKHLPLDAKDLAALAEQAEGVISDWPSGRQWHATELLTALIEAGSRQALAADKYVLDAALRRSGEMQSLGRLVWTRGGAGADQARIEVWQAVVALVRQAGGPLTTAEIRQRLVAIRGLDEHVQLNNRRPLIRVGPSLWGLIDRDIGLTSDEQIEFTDALAALLARRGTGLHASELAAVLTSNMSVETALSLASLDGRMRVSVGQYIYLESWGEPRRETVSAAVEAVLLNLDGPTPFIEIFGLVQDRIGRRCERTAVSGCLQALGATFGADGLWTRNASSNEDATDVELAA